MDGKRIVIVDDDPVVRLLLSECLMMYGHKVESFSQASDGVEWLSENSADLLFVDMIMPEMSGLEAIKRIKAIPAQAKLPIVILSANPERQIAKADAPQDRPDRVLEKPWDLKLLLQTVEELTANVKASD